VKTPSFLLRPFHFIDSFHASAISRHFSHYAAADADISYAFDIRYAMSY